MNNNFSLIARSDGNLLLLIFENDFNKDKVCFTIDNKKLKLIYPNNEKVIYGKLNKKEIKALSSRNKILVTEMDCDDAISNGEIKDSYIMQKI